MHGGAQQRRCSHVVEEGGHPEMNQSRDLSLVSVLKGGGNNDEGLGAWVGVGEGGRTKLT